MMFKNKMKKYKHVMNAFFSGWLVASCVVMFVQDYMGLDAWVHYARTHWVRLHWGYALAGMILGVISFALTLVLVRIEDDAKR